VADKATFTIHGGEFNGECIGTEDIEGAEAGGVILSLQELLDLAERAENCLIIRHGQWGDWPGDNHLWIVNYKYLDDF